MSISIMLLLIGVASVDFREGIRNEQLRTASQTLVEDFKRIENLALSGQTYDFEGDVRVPSAYGLFVDSLPAQGYALYADNDDTEFYFRADAIMGTGPVQLPEDVLITDIDIGTTPVPLKLSVAYEPPNPTMHYFVSDTENNIDAELKVVLQHEKTGNCRTVKLNRISGQASEAPSSCPEV
ncbi:MAG: hypothetical protein HYV34_02310 [Candidatus Kerfeldbacteria bacterium]|nr:hypothetical protein [Candidatus Kerfeldbacteria bacterium]